METNKSMSLIVTVIRNFINSTPSIWHLMSEEAMCHRLSYIIKQNVYVFASDVFMCSSVSQNTQEPLNVPMSNLPRMQR